MSKAAPIAVIGNANLDIVGGILPEWPEKGTETFLDRADNRIGGSAANTGLVLQRLGARSGLIASAGGDSVGAMIAAQFAGPLDRVMRAPCATSVTFGLLHPGSERTFFSTPGHLDQFDADEVQAGLDGWPLEGGIAMVSGSFALPALSASTRNLLRQLRRAGARTAIDPGWPDGGWTKANRALILDWIVESDVILLNDKELLGLTGCDTIAAGLDLIDLRPGAALVVKCGPEGALCRLGTDTFKASSPATEVFDTIGAGDAFNAGYLAALAAGQNPADCLKAGCIIASAVIRDFPRSTAPLSLPDPAERAAS